MGSDNPSGAENQQVGPRFGLPQRPQRGLRPIGRMMGWSDLHGDVQIGAEMTPRRQWCRVDPYVIQEMKYKLPY